MVYLQNEELKVELKEIGGEIVSVETKEGKQGIWNGDEKFWKGRAPHLFPICGRLRDNKYIYEGKEYTLLSHGFSRFMEYEVEEKTDTSVTFSVTETEETLKDYPFNFVFKIKYTLRGRQIDTEYIIKNTNDKTMYFSVGGHEGYMCEGGIENYYIEFDKNVTLDAHVVEGPIIRHETERIIENSNILPLKNDYFKIDALIFKDIDFDAVTIKKNDGTPNVRIDFKGFQNLVLWTIPGAPYLCVEPWFGLHDFVDSDYIFENKYAIQKLEAGKTFNAVHTMTF
ncbi:MAG: aldose 1-epimerase family protein [Ruminococcaceae bacterium]|nr:aldose 1-epimerase family protein [Oscillospiraceae bacterium]